MYQPLISTSVLPFGGTELLVSSYGPKSYVPQKLSIDELGIFLYLCGPNFNEAYKIILRTADDGAVQLLLLRYQHVPAYPHLERIFHCPFTPWRQLRPQPHPGADRSH